MNKKAILIPQQAVFRDTKGNPFVYVVDKENKVQIRPITVDRAIADKWLVSEGLQLGEKVIVEGFQRIMPGTPVKPVPYSKKYNLGNCYCHYGSRLSCHLQPSHSSVSISCSSINLHSGDLFRSFC